MATRELSHAVEFTGLITMHPEGIYSGPAALEQLSKSVKEEFENRGLQFRFLPPTQQGGTGIEASLPKQAMKALGVLVAVIRYLHRRYVRRATIIHALSTRQVLRLELQAISPDELSDEEARGLMLQALELWQSLARRVSIWSGGIVRLNGSIGVYQCCDSGVAAFALDYGALEDRTLFQLQKLTRGLRRGLFRRVFQGFWSSRLRFEKGQDERFQGKPIGIAD